MAGVAAKRQSTFSGGPPKKIAKPNPKDEDEESDTEEPPPEEIPKAKPKFRQVKKSTEEAEPPERHSKDHSSLQNEQESQFKRTVDARLTQDQTFTCENKSALRAILIPVRPNLQNLFRLITERIIDMEKTAADSSLHHMVQQHRFDKAMFMWAILGELDYFLYTAWKAHFSAPVRTRTPLKIACDLAALFQSLGAVIIEGCPSIVFDYVWWRERVLTSPKVRSMLGAYQDVPFECAMTRMAFLNMSENVFRRVRYLIVEIAYDNPLPSILGVGVYSASSSVPPAENIPTELLGSVSLITRRPLVPSEALFAGLLRLWTVTKNLKSGVYSPVFTNYAMENDCLRSHLTNSAHLAAVDGHILKGVYMDSYTAVTVPFK